MNYYCTTKHLPAFTMFRLQDVFEVQIGKLMLLVTLILHFFQFKQFNSSVGLGGNETCFCSAIDLLQILQLCII